MSSNLIRFREGFIERLAGWARLTNQRLAGVCRALHYWADLASLSWLGAGTNEQLYVYSIQGMPYTGSLYNITPVGWLGGFASSGGTLYKLLVWSLDNFGQVLIAIPSGGGLYIWTPPLAPNPPGLATQVLTAPLVSQGGFVAAAQQIVMAYGCAGGSGSVGDPMLVRWSDQSDYTDWTASTTNQAGSFRLSRGSRITGGVSCNLGQFLWTDLDIWGVQYIGFPAVFGFNILAANAGLLAQKAVVAVGNSIYWMSDHGFFALSGGGIQEIPCTVWDVVYFNLDEANQDKCLAGSDQHHNEVWFFYPSKNGGSGEIDSYVKYNYISNLWDFGPATPEQANLMSRTAWTDENKPGSPLNVDLNNLIQQNDVGVDADGQPMTGVEIVTGYQDMGDGVWEIFFDQFIPDFEWTLSTAADPSVEVSILYRDFPGDEPTVAGPVTVRPTTRYNTIRGRGREMAIKINCDGLGTWFRMGTNRIRMAKHGQI